VRLASGVRGFLGQRELVAWAKAAAIPFDPEAIAAGDVERLAALDPLLAGKRLAFVGESNHFVHEKIPFRVLVLRYLASRGFGVVGEELSWSDGLRIDRYLTSGDETWLGRVTAYGHTGDSRADRDDTPGGILTAPAYPTDAFRAEQLRFARALRALGAPGALGVRFFGFDIDYAPGAGYLHVSEWIARCPVAIAEPLRARLARLPGESQAQEADRLEGVCALFERSRRALEECIGAAGARELARSLATLAASHRYAAITYHEASYEALRPGMALRERTMWEHVDHVLEREGPAARIALLAHNQHLAKDASRIVTGAGVGPGGEQVDPLGTHLAKRHPGEVFAIWMLSAEGEDCQPFEHLPRRLRAPRGSLNAALAKVGPAFVLPTRSADPRARLLRESAVISGMYNATVRAAVAEQADAICFIRRVSPLRS
jgi:erythromycin esterase-like protein